MKWILNNMTLSGLILALASAVIGGAGYGVKLLNETAFEKGVNQERNVNLEKYQQSLKDNNETLVELITLRIKCRTCCPE